MGKCDEALVKAICEKDFGDLEKAHVRAFMRQTKSGKMVEVQEHDDKRQEGQDEHPAYTAYKKNMALPKAKVGEQGGRFEEGDVVRMNARGKNHEHMPEWYKKQHHNREGVVRRNNDNGTYHVLYNDEIAEKNFKERNIHAHTGDTWHHGDMTLTKTKDDYHKELVDRIKAERAAKKD